MHRAKDLIMLHFLVTLLILVIGTLACKDDKDCSMVKFTICQNEQCVCSPGYVYNGERTKCLQVSHGYESPCTDTVQCSASMDAGGICANGMCKCTEGYHYFLGKCWKSSGLGEKCNQNYNCFVSYDFEASICNEQNICECAPEYYLREYSSCRRVSSKVGDPCGISLDCHFENAVCTKERTCQINTSDTIKKVIKENEIDIIENRREKRGLLAKITKDFVEILVQASGFGSIGSKCKADADCPKNAECAKENVCFCKKGFYTLDNSTCHPELGGSCKIDDDCKLGKNTMCRDNKYCTCKQGFVTSYNSRYCDKMSRDFGWSCLRDEQCGFFGPGGKCVAKKCQCANDTHWIKDQLYCWVTKKVKDKCENNDDCGENTDMVCSDKNICECKGETHPSSNNKQCNKDSKEVGKPCMENIDCIYDHSACNTTTHLCSCTTSYIENKTTCISGITGECKDNKDCTMKNSHCGTKKKCECDDSYTASMKMDKCLPIANTIGFECNELAQCELLEADCINGKCSCKNDSSYLPNDNKCFVRTPIGGNCTTHQNCTSAIPHSECLKGHCHCLRGFKQRGKRCVNGGNISLPVDIMMIAGTLLVLFYGMKYKY